MITDLYFLDEKEKPHAASELSAYLLKARALVAINYLKENLEDPTQDVPPSITIRAIEARSVVAFFKEAGIEVEVIDLSKVKDTTFVEIAVHPPGGLEGYQYTNNEEAAPGADTE